MIKFGNNQLVARKILACHQGQGRIEEFSNPKVRGLSQVGMMNSQLLKEFQNIGLITISLLKVTWDN